MKISILHISDLHRDPHNPIRNDVLLDSLEVDRRQYTTQDAPAVRSPDLIIVSGDIVQGISPHEPDPEGTLRKQYQEALGFLTQLADRFVSGDRDRVVIVPGNHDVSAYHFHKSLRPVHIAADRKKDLFAALFASGSPLRWSWADFALHEIADPQLYARRLEAFAEFYATFYSGGRTYGLDASTQYDVFDLPRFGLTVVGFSSCSNNDLHNRQGAIHPACVASAATQLRLPAYRDRLLVAVWHHNIEGGPSQSDYMDPDLVQNLIARGFSLAFHGHQHRPQFLDTRFRHGFERSITIVSAGTLCGSPSYRHGRSYNVVELDTDPRAGRLHVREMQNDNLSMPIWSRRALSPNTTPYYDFRYQPPIVSDAPASANTAALLEAQTRYDANDYRAAAEILARVAPVDELARPLLLDCYLKLKDLLALIAAFDPPASEAEAVHLMDALWTEGKRDRLATILRHPLIAESVDPSVAEMRAKYFSRLSL